MDVLTLAFTTTVCMWFVGYVCRMPPAVTPSWLLLLLLLLCQFGGGVLARRWTDRGGKGGLLVGLLASILNLLVLGSLLSGERPNEIARAALLWLPGSLLAGAVLSGLGAVIPFPGNSARDRGSPSRHAPADSVDWISRFSVVAAGATLLLLIAGGLVTSDRAGLAVVDWPNSFGYAMFLYPLSRMTGGIYYEHAHRLFGSLVGLTTAVLAILILRRDRRGWVRAFAAGSFLLVVIQGILGGLRVTGRFTMSASVADTRPSLLLAVVHGITGQIFFAAMAALSAFTARGWRSPRPPAAHVSAGTDRSLGLWLVAALFVQLVIGAIFRHASRGLFLHIVTASLIALLAGTAGARGVLLPRGEPVLRRLGRALLILLGTQLCLGVAALGARTAAAGITPPPAYSVLLRTAHQACGALLLATATLLAAWNLRLLRPAARPATDDSATASGAS